MTTKSASQSFKSSRGRADITRRPPQSSHSLSAADLMSGGDNPYYRIEIPEIPKDGGPGVVYAIPPSTRRVFAITTLRVELNSNTDLTPRDRSTQINAKVNELIADHLVNPETGGPLLSLTEVDLLPLAVVNRLGVILTTPLDLNGKVGNDSSETGELATSGDSLSE